MAATPDQTAFETIVAESKTVIAEADPSPVKRGRGRPKKSDAETVASSPAPVVPVAQPPPDISLYIKGPLVALSKIPAHRTGIPSLALDDDEAAACANALNEIAKAFVPDANAMSPKTAAVVMGILTFGSIGFTKYQIYSEEMSRRHPEPVKEPEVQDEVASLQTMQPVRASDAFRRPGMNA